MQFLERKKHTHNCTEDNRMYERMKNRAKKVVSEAMR